MLCQVGLAVRHVAGLAQHSGKCLAIRVRISLYSEVTCWGEIEISNGTGRFAPFSSVLQRFRANQMRGSQRDDCSAFKLWSVPQYHPFAVQTITSLWFFQSRKIDLKIFLGVIRSSRLFRSVDHKPTYSYLNVHYDHVIKLRKACADSLCISAAFLPMKATPGETHLLLWHLLKKASCALSCVILWQNVVDRFVEAASSISMCQIWILSTSCLHVKYCFPL